MGLFDVMSHPDLVKKFGHYATNPLDFFEEAARVAGEAGVLVEVSTAGWRKPCKEQYPSVDLQIAERKGCSVYAGLRRA